MGRWNKQVGPLAGFVSGILLMLPGMVPVLAPVQVFAFVPLLFALRSSRRWRDCLHAGFLIGLGFIAPQLLWPMWGTAQSLVRCWSWYPGVIAFTSVTGAAGLIFVLGATQALAVNAILNRGQRAASIMSLAGVLAMVVVADAAVLSRKSVGQLKVATIGWALTPEEGGMGTSGAFDRLYAEPVAEAARQGARLVVSPETAFAEHDDPDRNAFSKFTELARLHDVYLAVGYLDTKSQENRVAVITPSGDVAARYAKTHLTPFENNPTGTGRPTVVTIDGVAVGAMICHDDNYTDISRRYGNQPAGIVVVPTNDWLSVRKAHFQSSIHRAIESRFAMVRAASNGISAVISATGERLAVSDHFSGGPGLLVAAVEVYDVRTPFSRFGNWFVVLSGVFVAVHSILSLSFRRRVHT